MSNEPEAPASEVATSEEATMRLLDEVLVTIARRRKDLQSYPTPPPP